MLRGSAWVIKLQNNGGSSDAETNGLGMICRSYLRWKVIWSHYFIKLSLCLAGWYNAVQYGGSYSLQNCYLFTKVRHGRATGNKLYDIRLQSGRLPVQTSRTFVCSTGVTRNPISSSIYAGKHSWSIWVERFHQHYTICSVLTHLASFLLHCGELSGGNTMSQNEAHRRNEKIVRLKVSIKKSAPTVRNR